jgi:hypothetical protein
MSHVSDKKTRCNTMQRVARRQSHDLASKTRNATRKRRTGTAAAARNAVRFGLLTMRRTAYILPGAAGG